jgi:hypothetical protein
MAGSLMASILLSTIHPLIMFNDTRRSTPAALQPAWYARISANIAGKIEVLLVMSKPYFRSLGPFSWSFGQTKLILSPAVVLLAIVQKHSTRYSMLEEMESIWSHQIWRSM